jgi:hypothetical protein
MLQIERGVTFPLTRSKYPFADMEPGDSILFQDKARANSARISSLRFVRLHQPAWKFAMRKVEGGWRMWRVV